GRAGETAQSVIKLGARPCTVLFLGVGDASPAALRRAGAALARRLPAGQTALSTAVLDAPDEGAAAFTEGLLLGSYQFTMKSGGAAAAGPAEVRLLRAGPEGHDGPVRQASLLAGAVALARDLANTPSMIKSPGWPTRRSGSRPSMACRPGSGPRPNWPAAGSAACSALAPARPVPRGSSS